MHNEKGLKQKQADVRRVNRKVLHTEMEYAQARKRELAHQISSALHTFLPMNVDSISRGHVGHGLRRAPVSLPHASYTSTWRPGAYRERPLPLGILAPPAHRDGY